KGSLEDLDPRTASRRHSLPVQSPACASQRLGGNVHPHYAGQLSLSEGQMQELTLAAAQVQERRRLRLTYSLQRCLQSLLMQPRLPEFKLFPRFGKLSLLALYLGLILDWSSVCGIKSRQSREKRGDQRTLVAQIAPGDQPTLGVQW